MLKVIARLRSVPENSVVTKLGGTVEHTVKHQITIYRQQGEEPTVIPAVDCVFLVTEQGAINTQGLDKKVIWHTDLDELNAMANDDGELEAL